MGRCLTRISEGEFGYEAVDHDAKSHLEENLRYENALTDSD